MIWNFSVEIELYNHSNFHANYLRRYSTLEKPNLQFTIAISQSSSCHVGRSLEELRIQQKEWFAWGCDDV